MKYGIWLLLVLPVTLFAQQSDNRSNSIGLFSESNSMFTSDRGPLMQTMGVQYLKRSKKVIEYKVSIGYSNYAEMPSYNGLYSIQSDTARWSNVSKKSNLGILGFGVEAKRQFYKKLYFFAGFDVRAGYGNGKSDTTGTKQYSAMQFNPVTNALQEVFITETFHREAPATMVYAGFTPYFGLKLEFKRFAIGTSFMNYFAYRSIQLKGGQNDALIEFDFSNITQQFFVRYKI